jgi:hypothetical protein
MKSSFTAPGTECIVIGEDDLWKKIATNDPDHRFGQPRQIVHVQGNQPTEENPTFQSASDVSGQLEAMRDFLKSKNVKFVHDRVIKIERAGRKIIVHTVRLRHYEADRVIVATGFGRSSLPRSECPADVQKALQKAGSWGMDSATKLFQNRIIGGTEYLYASDIKAPPAHYPFRVAIQGASATSSWAVLRALSLAREKQEVQITWITRSGFADANPAGRSSDILRKASDAGWLTKATVTAIGKPAKATDFVTLVLSPAGGGEERRPAKLSDLGQIYKKYYSSTTGTRRTAEMNLQITEIKRDTTIYVDHFVYALGADPSLPGGAGDIIAPGIRAELKPVIDTDKRFDDDPTATTLAFRTDDNQVWLVGAAVFRGGGIKDLQTSGGKFANISAMMSEAGSPPEGIAAIIAAAKAVTGWNNDDNSTPINLHTADFKEIETWFSQLYQHRTHKVPNPKTVRAMADQIVAMRKHSVFGLSVDEITNLGSPDNDFWNDMFSGDGVLLVDQLAAYA